MTTTTIIKNTQVISEEAASRQQLQGQGPQGAGGGGGGGGAGAAGPEDAQAMVQRVKEERRQKLLARLQKGQQGPK